MKFGEVQQRAQERCSGFQKKFTVFYTKSIVVNWEVFRPPHLFPLPHRPKEYRVHGYEHRYQRRVVRLNINISKGSPNCPPFSPSRGEPVGPSQSIVSYRVVRMTSK